MDASQITKLREQQQTKYINRNKCADASTLIWQNQIRSSTYIQGSNIGNCDGTVQNAPIPTQRCTREYGGGGRQMTLMSGSTQQYPSVFAGAKGSASQTFSSDSILLQKAGLQACGVAPPTSAIQIVLPTCNCDSNGPNTTNPTPVVNNMANPYLPAFDTFYAAKNKCFPVIDQHQKHYVAPCCSTIVCSK
jgi:hypothetical protein